MVFYNIIIKNCILFAETIFNQKIHAFAVILFNAGF